MTSLGAGLACGVSVFSGVIAYDPLLRIAENRAPDSTVAWWPLLVYGPWVAASLSVLRAAFQRRRATHSWLVILFFSFMAILLCAAQADRTYAGVAAATLPTAASLTCFQQLARSITLTKPPRKALPRHRAGRSSAPAPAPGPYSPFVPPHEERPPS
ncbi:DUF2637 domain-containing protein [Streptomyces gobitricini]|uniref:DUF2637 domain-containing protein n=1 Tax=Streptomyces gobitricini TaxID=68211 RepID=UPI0031E49757